MPTIWVLDGLLHDALFWNSCCWKNWYMKYCTVYSTGFQYWTDNLSFFDIELTMAAHSGCMFQLVTQGHYDMSAQCIESTLEQTCIWTDLPDTSCTVFDRRITFALSFGRQVGYLSNRPAERIQWTFLPVLSVSLTQWQSGTAKFCWQRFSTQVIILIKVNLRRCEHSRQWTQ